MLQRGFRYIAAQPFPVFRFGRGADKVVFEVVEARHVLFQRFGTSFSQPGVQAIRAFGRCVALDGDGGNGDIGVGLHRVDGCRYLVQLAAVVAVVGTDFRAAYREVDERRPRKESGLDAFHFGLHVCQSRDKLRSFGEPSDGLLPFGQHGVAAPVILPEKREAGSVHPFFVRNNRLISQCVGLFGVAERKLVGTAQHIFRVCPGVMVIAAPAVYAYCFQCLVGIAVHQQGRDKHGTVAFRRHRAQVEQHGYGEIPAVAFQRYAPSLQAVCQHVGLCPRQRSQGTRCKGKHHIAFKESVHSGYGY